MVKQYLERKDLPCNLKAKNVWENTGVSLEGVGTDNIKCLFGFISFNITPIIGGQINVVVCSDEAMGVLSVNILKRTVQNEPIFSLTPIQNPGHVCFSMVLVHMK